VSPVLKSLMANVTSAVVRAEGALKDATVHYASLVAAEQAIAECPEASEQDRKVARHGVENARRILNVLENVWK